MRIPETSAVRPVHPCETDDMEDGSEESWHDASENGWETACEEVEAGATVESEETRADVRPRERRNMEAGAQRGGRRRVRGKNKGSGGTKTGPMGHLTSG